MHKQRIAILGCSALGIVSCFLPWANVPIIGSVNGIQGSEGIIMIILFGPGLALALMGDKAVSLTGGRLLKVAIPAGLAGVHGLIKVVDFNSAIRNFQTDNPLAKILSSNVSVGIGLYLICAVGILCPILAYCFKDAEA